MLLSQNISCSEYDPTFFAVIRFVSLGGLLFNIIGLHIIHYHSPKSMTGYKRYMAFYQILSGFCDLTIGELVTPLVTLPMVAGIPVGQLRTLGIDTRLQVILGFLAAYTTFAAIGVLFLFRSSTVLPRGHWVSHADEQLLRVAIFWLTLIISAIFALQTFCFYFSRNVDHRAEARQEYPSFECIINDPFFFTYSDPYVKVIIIFIGGSLIGFMSLVGVCVGTAYHAIAHSNTTLSAKTKKLQWRAMMLLLGQVFIPLAIGVGPLVVGVALVMFNSVRTPALGPWIVLLTSNHGSLSTASIITLHPPYRKYAISKVRGKFKGLFGMTSTVSPGARPGQLKFVSTSVAGVSHARVF